MPPEEQTTVETTTEAAGGEMPPTQTQQPAHTFEDWLEKQPDDVKALLDTHTAGLKSALDKERKGRKTLEDKAADEKRKAEQANLSEVEKAQTAAKDFETKYTALVKQFEEWRIRSAIELKAAELGFHKPADASRLADLAEVKLDGDEVSGIEEALKALLKDRPYLAKEPAKKPAGETNATARGTTSGPVRTEQEKKELAAIYGVKPEYIP